MKALGGKMQCGEKESIELAVKALEGAIKGDDKAAIENKSKALSDASAKMAERLYARSGTDGAAANAGTGSSTGSDDVVDAEFEDVSKDK